MASDVELLLADIAAGQWGLVTAPQAVAAGVSRMQLSRLTSAGAVRRLAHGVYALRGVMNDEHLDLAAAWVGLEPARPVYERLADGASGAVVSHASAAALHGLGDLDADRHEFTTSGRKQSRRPDIRLHRGDLGPDDVMRREGLPTTTPIRTVVDLLADNHDGGHVAGVLADAVRRRLIDLIDLAVKIAPYAARYGLDRGDGDGLLRYLLELGGVSQQAEADQLAEIARIHSVRIGDLMNAAGADHHEELAAATAAALDAIDRIVPTQHEQLAATIAAMDRWLAPQREQVAAAISAALSSIQVPEIDIPESATTALRVALANMPPPLTAHERESLRSVAATLSAHLNDAAIPMNRNIDPAIGASLRAALNDVQRQSWTTTAGGAAAIAGQ